MSASPASEARSRERPTVAHLVDLYLPRSQTFIYRYLSRMETTRPVVLAQSLSHLDEFPLDNVFRVPQHPRMQAWRELLFYRLARDLFPVAGRYTRLCRRSNARLIHAHFGPVGFRALRVRRRTGLKLVTTFYGADMSMLPRRACWRRAYARLFREGEMFLVEGHGMAKKLAALGCPANKIRVQPIAVDVSQIAHAPRSWDGRAPLTILMAGRFVEKKGLRYAIEAFARVAARWPMTRLEIVGDGPLRAEIERTIRETGLAGRIRLLGSLDHRGYLERAAAASLFVAPSVTAADGDTEGGAPTTLLEMQAAGLPVLSTRHADIPEVVQDGASGFLVPERDVEALSARLDWLLSHADRWAEMGAAGREQMLCVHDVAQQAPRLERLYFELIGLGGPAA